MEYTSFNRPSSQAGAAGPDGRIRYTWQYDEGLARLKEVQRIASGADASTRTTWRLHPDNAGGLGFEHEVSVPDVWSPANPNTKQSRHYVTAMGQVVAVLVTEGNLPVPEGDDDRTPPEPSQITLRKVEFWQTDHLGSLITTADHMAKVTARYAYDPFGQRRFTDGQADGAQTLAIDWDPAVRQGTGHGFTGHEHLDDIGLVHMNGRLYDARLGVFMQPDPFIQEVDNLQNLHRYGYCYANPMGCRDPSGMIFKWLGRKIKAEWKRSALFRMAVTIVVAYYTGNVAADLYASSVASASSTAAASGYSAASAAAAAGETAQSVFFAFEHGFSAGNASAYAGAASSLTGQAIGGAVGGFSGSFVGSGGDLKQGIQGGITGGMSGGINGHFGSTYDAGRVLANGIAGGIGARLRGESFGSGFRTSASISALAYLNSRMRSEMINQSTNNRMNDGTGLSAGMYGDSFKLAGGRFFVGGDCSLLGCWQSGAGKIIGEGYRSGGLRDMVLESFAGPHDFANSPFWYDSFGNVLEYDGFHEIFLDVATNYSSSLVFALPFASAAILEQARLNSTRPKK